MTLVKRWDKNQVVEKYIKANWFAHTQNLQYINSLSETKDMDVEQKTKVKPAFAEVVRVDSFSQWQMRWDWSPEPFANQTCCHSTNPPQPEQYSPPQHKRHDWNWQALARKSTMLSPARWGFCNIHRSGPEGIQACGVQKAWHSRAAPLMADGHQVGTFGGTPLRWSCWQCGHPMQPMGPRGRWGEAAWGGNQRDAFIYVHAY